MRAEPTGAPLQRTKRSYRSFGGGARVVKGGALTAKARENGDGRGGVRGAPRGAQARELRARGRHLQQECVRRRLLVALALLVVSHFSPSHWRGSPRQDAGRQGRRQDQVRRAHPPRQGARQLLRGQREARTDDTWAARFSSTRRSRSRPSTTSWRPRRLTASTASRR